MSYFHYQSKKIYYKEIGSGKPLVMLHGDTASSRTVSYTHLDVYKRQAWLQIDRSDYEDKLREDVYTKEAECAISGNGKVTVY